MPRGPSRLADHHLRAVRTDLLYTRDALADRHADRPGRSTVPAGKPERCAVCACHPAPRSVPAPPDVAAVLRR